MKGEPGPLETIGSAELIAELVGRFKTAIVAVANERSDTDFRFGLAKNGDPLKVVGLIEWAKRSVLEDLKEASRPLKWPDL